MTFVHRPHSTLVQGDRFDKFATAAVPQHRHGSRAAASDAFPAEHAVADPQLSNAVSLGTTIIAVQFDGGVVLAADSRTSTGSYVANRTSNKLTKLTDRIYCCRSGSAADTQALAEEVSRDLNMKSVTDGAMPTVKSAATYFSNMCYQNRWDISAGIIVGGWDPINGGTVFNVPLGGALIQLNYAAGGSGSTFLMGWLDANFKIGMSKEQCLTFVRTAVSHAIARDGSSGGLIRTITLDQSGAEHTTTPWTKIPYRMETDPNLALLAPQNQAPASDSNQTPNVEDSTQL